MTAKAIGIIEAIGLAAAIEAADAAAKAANVTVLGYENARGGGRITVKLVGDVGAVKAAVSAGSAAALRVGKVAGCLVIPRPHDEIAALIARVDRGHAPRHPAPSAPAAPEPVVAAPEPVVVAPEPVVAVPEPEATSAEPDIAVAEPSVSAVDVQDFPTSPEAEPLSHEVEQRKSAPVRRGKARKSEPPTTQDSGEVEG